MSQPDDQTKRQTDQHDILTADHFLRRFLCPFERLLLQRIDKCIHPLPLEQFQNFNRGICNRTGVGHNIGAKLLVLRRSVGLHGEVMFHRVAVGGDEELPRLAGDL